MAEKINHHDFVEVNYTGKLIDGTIFDTTEEKVAKENGIYDPKMNFAPAVICVGERQILPGLDEQLEGREVGPEYTVELSPEKAFGKRDIKKMRIMPMSAFKEQQMQPQPGLQIEVDGQIGIISKVSGGRIMVNFNHPLAGKEVVYTFKVTKKILDQKEQILAFLNATLRIPEEKMKVEVAGENAKVELPTALPAPFTEALGKKLAELVKLKSIEFSGKKGKEESLPTKNVV